MFLRKLESRTETRFLGVLNAKMCEAKLGAVYTTMLLENVKYKRKQPYIKKGI